MQNLLFEFIAPLILLTLIVYALLRKIKFSDNDRINLAIAFTLSFIGTYSLYNLQLSQFLISSAGITIAIIFISLVIIASARKGYKKVEEQFKKEEKK
ncbi:MAG: hypothetical protein QXQ14_00150 [Candidatus Aenigmatarchaeota archaeon]